MANESLPQPIEGFERQVLAHGSRLGSGDAMALYDMPETIQEAFAAGFNRRSEIAELLAEEHKAQVVALKTPEEIKPVDWVGAASAPTGLDPDVTIQRDLLANAIAEAAVKRGIWRAGVSATGPQLIQVLQDLARAPDESDAAEPSEQPVS